MENTKRGFISNFFVEMIVVILFFSIASIILVRIYATTVYKNDINKIKSSVIINASSIIDIYKSGDEVKEAVKKVTGEKDEFTKEDNNIAIRLNKHLESHKNGVIKLIIIEKNKDTKTGKIKTLTLKYIYKNIELYVIEGKKYVKKK